MKFTKVLFLFLSLTAMQSAFAAQGTFTVSARNPFGTAFTNPEAGPITITVFASGQWSWRPGDQSGPEGSSTVPCSLFGNCPLGYNGVGSLIVRNGPNFAYVGSTAQIELTQGQTIYFLFNDAESGFGDNSGQVTVNWVCTTGC